MKSKRILILTLIFLLFASGAIATDFEWMRNMNVRAEADASGFRTQLATRFHIGESEVGVILGNVERPADAYMVLRLGEMAGKPTDRVLRQYREGKGRGWGVMAQRLGIKPGSAEFKQLKESDDLYKKPSWDEKEDKDKHGKGKGEGKGKTKK
ncbi:MAG: hypothetical protein C0622_03160 [Desulfuromonas sp.]|nr:MAG: hypothetical protein C0622_03160 [Desulfuromonas sp.]